MIKKFQNTLLILLIPACIYAQDIDLSNWKITIPAGEEKPIEVEPPEIFDFVS